MSSALTALSPLDGRYAAKTRPLQDHFSEFALMRERAVEVSLSGAGAGRRGLVHAPQAFSAATRAELEKAVAAFGLADAERIKAIEATTNHDVKAVEYWLRERFAANAEVSAAAEFIHFACTSEDINNLSHARMLRGGRDKVLLPAIDAIVARMEVLATKHAEVAMLARTHGQPATPTTLGKEMANVAHRPRRARRDPPGRSKSWERSTAPPGTSMPT
jgi:adenylosuccinate lyase